MRNDQNPCRARWSRHLGRVIIGAGSLSMLAGMIGCETDAWFHDPSVIGYWEHTPTRVPILERISAIEGPADEFVEVEQIQPQDLKPVVEAYRVSSGDLVEVQIWDIPVVGQPSLFQPIVDAQGFIELPQLGQIYVHGMTVDEVRESIINAAADLVADPVVTVTVTSRRDQTYSIIGQVGGPGTYLVPEPDFRLLEAVTTAGGIPESIPEVYIIRQVALSESVRGVGEEPQGPTGQTGNDQRPAPPSAEELIDIIDDLTTPEDEGDNGNDNGNDNGGGGSPALYATSNPDRKFSYRQPEQEEPPIDLIDADDNATEQPAEGAVPSREGGSWMFLNGKWVRVRTPGTGEEGGVPSSGEDLAQTAEQLVTQRVIVVPTNRLLAGDARYNPVIRPGDVIRVPSPIQGPVYIAGFVNRPGTYTLPAVGKLTLTQAITSAGGLASVAMPERVDLTRRVDESHQATIRLNLRAIFERTQPDVFLKPEDSINVGTNFWAFPWAVARNGFRMTYGFGFLLDRNFGNDVFGAPPVNRGF